MAKILIADDNTNIQKMVALAFEERGIDVVSVGNGETAVRKLPDVDPDLVLADVFMPVRNGYEVCEFVKKDGRYAHVPVILLVGAFDPLDEKEARRVGADGVLKKPFVPPDPLISMVMSALERNPRVAAELAKAKEVIPEPAPMPQALENPAQKVPVPLPDFPEPSPEEAAQIYGFGKGVRTLDNAEDGPKNSAPKKPESEEDDEFDASTTQRDWRRRGMDLDIPDDIAAKPAFTTEQDFSPVSFPSEKDVPPRHIRTPQPEAVSLGSAKTHLELPLELEEPPTSKRKGVAPRQELPVSSASAPVPGSSAPDVAEPESARPSRGFFASIFRSRRTEDVAAPPEPQVASDAVLPAVEASTASSSPVSSPISAHEPEPQQDPQVEPEPQLATSLHWMDLMSPDPSAGSESWMDALSPKEAPSPAPAVDESATSSAVEESAAPKVHYDVAASPEPGPSGEIERKEQVGEHRASNHDAGQEELSYRLASDEPAPSTEAFASYEASLSEPAIESFFVDPELSAPPAAAPQADSSFFASEPEQIAVPELPSEPVAPPHEFAAETTVAETVSRIFSSPLQNSTERIPTAPPPNREALAGIPFLMPPKEITEPVDITPPAVAAAPPVDVEAVVQKVVERLGPQLQEILAQGLLKPLVESVLQQELARKEK